MPRFQWAHGKSPWDAGHQRYESAALLEAMLAGCPDVQLIVTSSKASSRGRDEFIAQVGAELGGRVAAFTYEDLTTKPKPGGRSPVFSASEFWRLTKSEIIRAHRAWLRPDAWVAVEAETDLWTSEGLRNHVCATNPSKGLLDKESQDRLMALLASNFGVSGCPGNCGAFDFAIADSD